MFIWSLLTEKKNKPEESSVYSEVKIGSLAGTVHLNFYCAEQYKWWGQNPQCGKETFSEGNEAATETSEHGKCGWNLLLAMNEDCRRHLSWLTVHPHSLIVMLIFTWSLPSFKLSLFLLCGIIQCLSGLYRPEL